MKENDYSSGINGVDYYTGGFRRGELGVICSTPGGGKTMTLVNMAGTNMLRGHKVVFFTIETSEDIILEKIYANIFREPYIGHVNLNAFQNKINKLNKLNCGTISIRKLDIKNNIATNLDFIRNASKEADFIIIDDIEYLVAKKSEILRELRTIISGTNKSIVISVNANKGALNKDIVDLEHLKIYKLVYIADVILTLSNTFEEKKEDEDGHTRTKIYIAKSRAVGNANKVIPIVKDNRTMHFIKDKQYIRNLIVE